MYYNRMNLITIIEFNFQVSTNGGLSQCFYC